MNWPPLSAEWDFSENEKLDPYVLTLGSHKEASWICSFGHKYKSKINTRGILGPGCPYCSGRKPSKENNLLIINPAISKEWNYKLNFPDRPENFSPNSHHKVYWTASCGHTWLAEIKSRNLMGVGCNRCASEKRKKTLFDKYGETSILGITQFQEKRKKTMRERYGEEIPLKIKEFKKKQEETCIEKYGYPCSMQNSEVALKNVKSQNNIIIEKYWKTNEELICQGGYETKTVKYWNGNKEDFRWQIVFKIPKDEPVIGGKTYRVDAYLPNKDLYIEIKGYFRNPLSLLKWEWFHRTYPNSELWNKNKLKSLRIL